MSDQGTAEAFAEIGREKRRAQQAGDQSRLAELEEMSATLHTASGNEAEARRALRRALKHRIKAGDEARIAKTRYGLALMEARIPGRVAEGRAGFQQALGEFREAGDHEMIGRTLLRLAGLDIAGERYRDASAASLGAAEAFAEAGQVDEQVDALRLGSYAAQLGGDTSEAMQLLSAALAAAPSVDTALSIRLDGGAVGLLDTPGPAELEGMLDEAAHGPMRGPLLLMRASERAAAGSLDGAEADAQEARRLALGGSDPVLYLMACLQLAGVREAAGDRTGLLTILFTCQASLGDLLGDEARVPVLHVIDSIRTQWGDEAFEAEMVHYRAQFEEATS